MRSDADLIAAEHRNFIASYRTLAGHSAKGQVREGRVFAFVTGHPVALFNGCVVTEAVTGDELRDALRWVRSHDVPFTLWIAAEAVDGIADVPAAAGLAPDEAAIPGMVLYLPPEMPSPPTGVTVAPVDDSTFDRYLDVWAAGGMPRELVERLIPPSMIADPDVRLFIGSLEGRPVATSIAIRSGDVSGVYAVGTLERARRRGIGTAVTWAAIDAARAWGCDAVVLQATAMGRPVYEAIGFRTMVSYASWIHRPERPAPPVADGDAPPDAP